MPDCIEVKLQYKPGASIGRLGKFTAQFFHGEHKGNEVTLSEAAWQQAINSAENEDFKRVLNDVTFEARVSVQRVTFPDTITLDVLQAWKERAFIQLWEDSHGRSLYDYMLPKAIPLCSDRHYTIKNNTCSSMLMSAFLCLGSAGFIVAVPLFLFRNKDSDSAFQALSLTTLACVVLAFIALYAALLRMCFRLPLVEGLHFNVGDSLESSAPDEELASAGAGAGEMQKVDKTVEPKVTNEVRAPKEATIVNEKTRLLL
jgi:hypothetical protein